jgi:hypothetical protein
MKAELEPSTSGKFFDNLHMLLLALLHYRLQLASRNLAEGVWRLELWWLYGLRKLLHEFFSVALDLWPC